MVTAYRAAASARGFFVVTGAVYGFVFRRVVENSDPGEGSLV